MAVPGTVAADVRSTINKRDRHGVVRHGAEWLTLWADPVSVQTPAERLAAQLAARARDRRHEAIAATARALAGADVRLPPADAAGDPSDEAWRRARGAADDAGLRQRHHDAALHAALAPAEPRARALFDALEAARVRALGIGPMPGIRANVAAVLAARLDALGILQAQLAAQVPLAEALPTLALEALTDGEDLIDSGAMATWRLFARRHFARELAALPPLLPDQRGFAAGAHLAIAAMMRAMEWDASPGAPAAAEALPGDGDAREDDRAVRRPAAVPDAAAAPRAGPGGSASPVPVQHAAYRAYTTDHDRVVPADELASPAELRELRALLDQSVAAARAGTSRLAQRLQRHLLAEQTTTWTFDEDEGLLDAGRLARVVTDPARPLAFKREREAPTRNTVVSLLIDNSGSMRGPPIALAAMAADLASAALERAGIACEILGFTTGGWRGGESAKRWTAAGAPGHPGRLCDLRHIVYKAAATPYRTAQLAIAAMLREGLLRENVDGEALLWAASRLRERPERRRLLLVISDGAPSDRATLDANADPALLDRHLRTVIAAIERQGRIELSAIGLRHDVRRLYRDAVVVERPDQLGPALLSQLGSKLRTRG
jgi:cobaltochelatase CobT